MKTHRYASLAHIPICKQHHDRNVAPNVILTKQEKLHTINMRKQHKILV
jgi:hypothetical protein